VQRSHGRQREARIRPAARGGTRPRRTRVRPESAERPRRHCGCPWRHPSVSHHHFKSPTVSGFDLILSLSLPFRSIHLSPPHWRSPSIVHAAATVLAASRSGRAYLSFTIFALFLSPLVDARAVLQLHRGILQQCMRWRARPSPLRISAAPAPYPAAYHFSGTAVPFLHAGHCSVGFLLLILKRWVALLAHRSTTVSIPCLRHISACSDATGATNLFQGFLLSQTISKSALRTTKCRYSIGHL
jgi:hypothetical protein